MLAKILSFQKLCTPLSAFLSSILETTFGLCQSVVSYLVRDALIIPAAGLCLVLNTELKTEYCVSAEL